MNWRAVLRLHAPASIVLVCAACGGGSDGGGTVPSCLDLIGTTPPAAGKVVTREAAGGCESATLEVVVTDVADLHSARFTVRFDPAVVRYDGFSTAGSILGSDGATVQVLEDRASDRVTIGLTRLGSSSGVDAAGSRVLVKLLYTRVGAAGASGSLDYQDATLYGSETPPVAKPGLTWAGGTLRVA